MSKNSRNNSLRLPDYDYSQLGGYYVTVCTHQKTRVFGDVVDDEVRLSDVGQVVEQCWTAIPEHFEQVTLGMYVIMPNHLHGIIFIHDKQRDPAESVEAKHVSPLRTTTEKPKQAGSPAQSLSAIISSFKASVTRVVRQQQSSDIKLWQRGFYDHIIRNEDDHRRIQQYIHDNPFKWESDDYYEELRGENYIPPHDLLQIYIVRK